MAPPEEDEQLDGGPPRPATIDEKREEALLAMCIAQPDPGSEYLARLTPEHLVSPRSVRALEWLRDHLKHPLEGLDRADDELFSEVSRLALIAETHPAEQPAMELGWLMVERARIDREIAGLRRSAAAPGQEAVDAVEGGGADVVPFERVVELQRERARIADQIASRGG